MMNKYDTNKQISEAMTKHGAFYAFGDKQFDEQKKEGIKYGSMGAGLVCPIDNADALKEDINNAVKGKIDWELANNTKKDIIWYHFGNHECQISGDYTCVIGILSDYGITKDEVHAEWKPYFNHCVKNDYF